MIIPSVGGTDDVLRDLSDKSKEVEMGDFLNLLMMQLKNQDPTEPMDNNEFISTLAQFTTLEAMNSLAKDMSEMLGVQKMVEARQLIGKQVDWWDEESEALHSGVVESVEVHDDLPMLVVDGVLVDPDSVRRTSAAPPAPSESAVG